MKKYYLALALAALTSVAQANVCTVFNTTSVSTATTPTCNLTSTLTGTTGNQVTACSFTFNNCTLTSWGSGLLYCNVNGTTIGTCTKTSTSWICNLDANGLSLLNNCLANNSICDFKLTCTGGWSVGGCTANYTCTPTPKSVPDAASTASLLAAALTGASLLRRKLA